MIKIPIIIPSYEPDNRLIILLRELRDEKMGPVILVNDGSSEKYDAIFNQAKELIAGCGGVLLVHETNRGKGRALKTAFDYILDNIPEALGTVTADSDGQHTVKSIKAISNELAVDNSKLVLGVRKFDGEGIPWKSRFGNNLTEKIFQYTSGVHVSDTQTGLRGIPISFMRELLEVKGERFEFEMRMLLESAGRYSITEIPIETIYDSETEHQTHFNPIKDSIRIYKILGEKFLKYIFASCSSSIIDLVCFTVICFLIKNIQPVFYITIATIVARVISATYNYMMNYKVVFKSRESLFGSSMKYILLAAVQMVLSAILVTLGHSLITCVSELFVKIIVDTVLFFVSYHIQQKYVF